MSASRWAFGTVGVALASYGALLALTRQEPRQLAEAALWLAGGVALHDVVVSGAVLGAAALGARALPVSWRAPAVRALVVWGSVSLMAIPVLGRFGARPDNPTLLDRPYVTAWLVASALTALAVALAGLVGTRRSEVD